jgi:hypothetical protein
MSLVIKLLRPHIARPAHKSAKHLDRRATANYIAHMNLFTFLSASAMAVAVTLANKLVNRD